MPAPADPLRRLDARLHAFAHIFDPPLGAAVGPTFAVKDLIDVAGAPTGGGGRAPLAEAPERHAVVVERLLAAGWRCVGKTHTVELAYGGWGTNRAVGAPWNPWRADVHHAPGGSSSGSAVAVAAGLCDLALGTDTGGSVRIPAALCGVVGLKPGRDLVSLDGVHPLTPSLDTVGVLAPDVAAAARGLELIAGADGTGRLDAETALATEPARLRLAAFAPDALGELDEEVEAAFRASLDRLRAAGATVEVAVAPHPLEFWFQPVTTLMAGEGWRVRRAHIERNAPLMDPWIVQRFRAGQAISDDALAEAQEVRRQHQAEMHAWFRRWDAVLLPTCPIAAPPLDAVDESVSPLSRLTRMANYLDLPAASVPCGLSDQGLPIGLQFVGGVRGETGVIAAAAAFERASEWRARKPDLSGFG